MSHLVDVDKLTKVAIVPFTLVLSLTSKIGGFSF